MSRSNPTPTNPAGRFLQWSGGTDDKGKLTYWDKQAEERKTVELPCTVDLSALPGIAWSVVAGGFDVHYQLDTEFTVPLFGSLSPKVKTSFGGDLSLARTVTGWTAQIKERIASK